MSVQIIQDGNGKATGVFIPISQWRQLKKQYKHLEALEYVEPSREAVLNNIKKGFEEMQLITGGKLKTTSAQIF